MDEKQKIEYVLALKIPKHIEVELSPFPINTLTLTDSSTIDKIRIKLSLMTRLGEKFTETISASNVFLENNFDEIEYDLSTFYKI